MYLSDFKEAECWHLGRRNVRGRSVTFGRDFGKLHAGVVFLETNLMVTKYLFIRNFIHLFYVFIYSFICDLTVL